MVSLSSMIAAVIITLSTFILPSILPVLLPEQDWLLSCIAVIVTAFIFFIYIDKIFSEFDKELKAVFLLA